MRSEGYSSLLATFLCVSESVCLSVCYHASEGIAGFYAKTKIAYGISVGFKLVHFQKKPSVQKLWRENANMLMSINLAYRDRLLVR